MHRDVLDATAKLKACPVYSTPSGKPAAAIAPGAPPHLDLGHGMGTVRAASYAPNPPGSGYESTGTLSRKEMRDSGMGPLPAGVRDQLLRFTATKAAALVDLGDTMADTVGPAAFSLWLAHTQVRCAALRRPPRFCCHTRGACRMMILTR